MLKVISFYIIIIFRRKGMQNKDIENPRQKSSPSPVSRGESPSGFLGPIGQATDYVQQVINWLGSIDTPRSVIIEIDNHTEIDLEMVGYDHLHGGWGHTPVGRIERGQTLVCSAMDTGVFTGAEGTITYKGPGIEIKAYWDNPFVGSNECDLQLTGPNAEYYSIFHICGSGDNNAHMRYEIYPKTN